MCLRDSKKAQVSGEEGEREKGGDGIIRSLIIIYLLGQLCVKLMNA